MSPSLGSLELVLSSAVRRPAPTAAVVQVLALALTLVAPSAASLGRPIKTGVVPGIYSVSLNGPPPHLLYRGRVNSLSLGPKGLIAFRAGDAVKVASAGFAHILTVGRAAPDTEGSDPPAWSPDGKSIAVSDAHCPDPSAPCEASSIYLFDPTGRARPRRIVKSGQAPSWAPNGKTLAYGGHWVDDPQGRPEGAQWLFVASASGAHPHVLAHGRAPLFSPRSDTIAYLAERDGGVLAGIHTILVTGKADRLLVSEAVNFAWAPDGSRIAAEGGPLTARKLLVFPAAGGRATPIASLYEGGDGPAWSANGARLAWIDLDPRSHAEQLFTALADGPHAAVKLTSWPSGTHLRTPAFSRSGKSLLVVVQPPS